MDLWLLYLSLIVMSARNVMSEELLHPEMATWTSCEEFVNNTKLDVDKVVDTIWKIFYFWTPGTETSYDIQFTRPSSTLLDRFRVEIGDIQPPVNWSLAELFLETSMEFNALLLRTPTPGIFRVIPADAIEYNVLTPYVTFALKLVGSFLGIATCKYRICYALAPVDQMPHHTELEEAAKTLQFYNPYNRTHLPQMQHPPKYVVAEHRPDYDDIVDRVPEEYLDNLDIF